LFSNTPLILETTDDILGVQALGGLKNIIAIGYGLLEQVCPSANMHASYLSLIMQEAHHLVKDLGGDCKTLMCFAGWSDVIVSCSKGRNHQFGRSFPNAYQGRAEGLDTLHALSTKLGYKMDKYPIFKAIYDVVLGLFPIHTLMDCLQQRNGRIKK
jgi:glycerol-3-phosphate dehydrogenase